MLGHQTKAVNKIAIISDEVNCLGYMRWREVSLYCAARFIPRATQSISSRIGARISKRSIIKANNTVEI